MSAPAIIRWERDEDGIVVLTIDDPDNPVNTLNAAMRAALAETAERVHEQADDIVGVIVTSAKKTFFAGADLRELRSMTRDQAAEVAATISSMTASLRRLETLGKPVVAAIDGAALGGGLEIALACHHRIATDRPNIQIGFPEVTLGLLPGGGGVVRSVRMLGIMTALEVLIEGRRYTPAQALEIGLIDRLVATGDELLPAAKAWIQSAPQPGAPWDRPGFKIPGGDPAALAATIPALPANLRKRLKGANYPAPHHILAAAVEGAQVDFASASRIETRYFVDLVTGQVAKNMIQAFFFDIQQSRGSRGRSSTAPFRPKKVVVLGAGMMGAAIAHVCAKAGLDVVLRDVSAEAAERGKAHSRELLEHAVARGTATQQEMHALLERITPTASPADATGADLLIEAVYEDPAVKAAVFAEIEPYLDPEALLASNTSTLPIGGLAEHVTRPADFIGLHFFSPVEKMPLLEIVKGAQTSEGTLGRALDVAALIAKTPIVVNDSRGFFTSRVIGTFINEGIAMLGEGVPAASIEQASSQAGYPAPVLQLSDELNLELFRRIRDANRAAAQEAGTTWRPHPAEAIVDRMVVALGRSGRAAGAGFYAYQDGRRTGLWPGLRDAFPASADTPPFGDLMERLLFIEALEATRCYEEGVIESVADANVGSILGIGFPGWTGGVLQYINGHAGGVAGFVARSQELAERYGERFAAPESLVERARRGEPFFDERPVAATV